MRNLDEFINESIDRSNLKLVFDNQLNFARAFKKQANDLFGKDTLKQKKINADIYFDDIECVDSNDDSTIKGVTCDGKMTWGEANDKLIEFFKTKYKL